MIRSGVVVVPEAVSDHLELQFAHGAEHQIVRQQRTEEVTEIPRSCSMVIQSEVACRVALHDLTELAVRIAPPKGSSFSVHECHTRVDLRRAAEYASPP